MWLNAATVSNVAILQDRGVTVIEPASGRLTGTDTGVGRLPEPAQIFEAALNVSRSKDLLGKKVLVIAGGTREPVDAVRFIGNRSSGKQGLALVEAAKSRGAEVTLIAANISSTISGIERCSVSSVEDLQSSLKQVGLKFDFILMPAAISDYRVASPSASKLKKAELGEKFSLDMVRNPDIIAGIAESKPANTKLVGFAAETESGAALKSVAFSKLQAKKLDLIVANDVSEGKAFDQDFNEVVMMSKTESSEVSGTKLEIANKIFDLLLTAK
jgi:phosphopantothenoylcysteine decarboxylase/phosphopantothenate--cysteine ligase